MPEKEKSPSEKMAPGSLAAVARGCQCPPVDNRNGRGWPGENGKPSFYLSDKCPLHKVKPAEHEENHPHKPTQDKEEPQDGKEGAGDNREDLQI